MGSWAGEVDQPAVLHGGPVTLGLGTGLKVLGELKCWTEDKGRNQLHGSSTPAGMWQRMEPGLIGTIQDSSGLLDLV